MSKRRETCSFAAGTAMTATISSDLTGGATLTNGDADVVAGVTVVSAANLNQGLFRVNLPPNASGPVANLFTSTSGRVTR